MNHLTEILLYAISFFTGALLSLCFVLFCDYRDFRRDLRRHSGRGTAASH